MSNYKESSVSGTAYQRCRQIVIENPYLGVPMVRMAEEFIADVDGRTFKTELSGISATFNPDESFPIINPITGEATGASISGAEIYVALYSYYLKKAAERDASNP